MKTDEGLSHANIGVARKGLHQLSGQGRANHRSTTKAHDGHARGHAPSVWEPLDQGADRRDVAKPKPDAPNHPRAQQHEPELMQVHTQCGDQHSATPAKGTDHTSLARANTLKPPTPQSSRGAQQHKEKCVHPA